MIALREPGLSLYDPNRSLIESCCVDRMQLKMTEERKIVVEDRLVWTWYYDM